VELTWGERVELRRVDLVPEMQTAADKIEAALVAGPLTAAQLAATLGMADNAIRVHLSRHADRFREVGKRGRTVVYGLAGEGLDL
jgi:predicted ArsR family transcriptional regulator